MLFERLDRLGRPIACIPMAMPLLDRPIDGDSAIHARQ